MRPPVLIRGRRGQAAVLVALVLFAMLLLVALATNIGIVVNDKIRMQTTADLSTYAAAYSEAASLNEMVNYNKEIVDAVQECRRILGTGNAGGMWLDEMPCGCRNRSEAAELAIQMCKANIDIAITRFMNRARYERTVGPALDAGEATAEANFAGVDIDFFSSPFFAGSPTARGTYWLRGGLNLGPTMVYPSIADIRQVTDTGLNYSVLTFCGEPPECVPTTMLSNTTYVKSWFYKDSRDPDVWVAGRASGTPEKQFLDTDFRRGGGDRGYFGASSTGGDDKLFAYAVAKPFEGSLGPAALSGTQRNGNAAVNPLGVFTARGAGYPELSMYDEYRARLAGLNENLAGSRSPTDLALQDGFREGRVWDVSKFKH